MSPELTASLAGAIAGAAIGYFSAWKVGIGMLRKQERLRAGAEFKVSFIESLRLLAIPHPNHSIEYKATIDILKEQYIVLTRSALLFQQFLDSQEHSEFLEKWNEFCCFDSEHKYPTFKDYQKQVNQETEWKVRELAVRRIHGLMDYANIK